MKRLLSIFALAFVFMTTALQAQTTDLGNPKSWWIKPALSEPTEWVLPPFDVERCLREDALNEANKVGAWRFGYEHRVSHTLQNAGTWETLPNGDRIWRLTYHSPGAYSLNFIFEQFELPQGAALYLYRPDRKEYLGAYTAANNNPESMLGTEIVSGERVTLEYYEPAAVQGQGILQVGMVIHAYKNVAKYASQLMDGLQKDLNDAGDCNYDVNCPLGNNWRDQINSVAMIMVNGSGFCSGSLLNNTRNDGTPYFLTANHCFSGSPATWVFRFNWDSPTPVCATTANSVDPGPPYNSVNGATLRARNAGSDFCLLELTTRPTGNIYYAGWDRTGNAVSAGVGIHHPSGDIKKICLDSNALTSTTWGNPVAQVWRVNNWDFGVTEGGSSGSPLFDPAKRVIGQLYGGTAACSGTNDNNANDNYGRLSISWTGGGTSSTRLSDWLDPTATGLTFIDGYDPNASTASNDGGIQSVNGLTGRYCNVSVFTPEVTLRNYGVDTLTSASIAYSLNGGTAQTYNWTGNLAPGATNDLTLNNITVTQSGSQTFSATVTLANGQADTVTQNSSASASFDVVLNGTQIPFTLQPDCYGDETTWELRDSSGRVLDQGGPYTVVNNPPVQNSTWCLEDGCYTFAVFDSYGDGMFGGNGCNVGSVNYGNYYALGTAGDTLFRMTATNGDFGDSAVHNFCLVPPVAPTAAATHSSLYICEGASVTFNASSSTAAATYAWSFQGATPATSTQAVATATYPSAGPYAATLIVSNSVGSDTLDFMVIVVGNVVPFSGTVQNASAANNDGSITLTGTDTSYTYLWSNGATTESLSGLAGGTYTVTVTTAAGCTDSQSFTVATAPSGLDRQTAMQYFALFPNPSSGQVQLAYRLNEQKDLRVQIYSATGQLLQSIEGGTQIEGQMELDLSAYPSGFYMVRFQAGSETRMQKVSKQ